MGAWEPHLTTKLYLSFGRYDFLLLGQLLLFFKKSGFIGIQIGYKRVLLFSATNRALLILLAFDT